MLAEIYKFLDGTDWNVGALDEALSTMFVQFRYHNEKNWKWKFEDYFGVEAYTVFMVLLCLLCVVSLIATELWSYVGWFVQLKRLFVLSIVVSLGWNWLYLCKVAFAERQAEIAKMGKFDDKCGEKVTWYDSFLDYLKGSVTFRNDPCEEYYKALMIDPVLLVPPTKALAVTFTNFITEPLKHIGKGIGEFLNALLSEIPLAYQAPVLIFIAVVFLGFWYGAGKAFVAVHRDRNLPGPERDRHLPDNPQRPNQDRFIENVNPLPPQNQLLQGEGDRGNVQNTVDGNRWPSQNQLQEGKSEVNLNQRRPRLMDKKGDQRSRTDFEHNRMYITPGNTVAAQVNDQYNNEDNRQSS
ncbi:hypothetical protein GDO86_007609 [Hymenochirus boettgeri]|uniref:Chloride channel CLIC-like protein 1 n=1 Tax=Hymenochirus boettgeri TaxID=247094 RepID=A0A8T2J1L2_9PIPI|nr:hypothetical protein GDO86_007609 [Hymenochirus boettgeri]